MWLMTQHGFYSVVKKGEDAYHLRARERGDLQNLIDRIPLPDQAIIDTPDGDYTSRLIVDHHTVAAILGFLAETIDYTNFKGRIDKTSDQCRKPYHDVWQVMADALGAYGKPGTAPGERDP